jgi:uncharacterized metal-binding protein YceD (DUF177 family)
LPSFILETVHVPLTALHKGKEEFSFELPIGSDFEGERIHIDTVHVNARFSLLGEDILLNLSLRLEGEFRCDRCSEKYNESIEGQITTLFTPDPLKLQNAEGGEIRLFNIHASELDITQEITDAVILTIPDKLLCRKDCRGLCENCGINLNEGGCQCSNKTSDSRWDALKRIQFD